MMYSDEFVEKLQEEAEKDYKDMRKFQEKFIAADRENIRLKCDCYAAYHALRVNNTVRAYNILEKIHGQATTIHTDESNTGNAQNAVDAKQGTQSGTEGHEPMLLFMQQEEVEG